MTFKTKKHFGQNFLKSKNVVKNMLKAAGVNEADTILEIGPGKGILTEELLKNAGKVIAVEKDRELIPILEEKFSAEIKNGKLILLNEDIRDFKIEKFLKAKENYKLVANIPYYITGEIIRQFLEGEKRQPVSLTLLIQKEVAERIIANNQKESVLSLSVKVFGQPKKAGSVSKENFIPTPKVDSAILHVGNISTEKLGKMRPEDFFAVVKIGFSHKRKLLLGNLKEKFASETLKKVFLGAKIDEKARAEDLKLEDWLKITELLHK